MLFRPRFLSFIFCFCFSFSPTDLHLYITVTGRVPSLNAPSIFTTFVIPTFVSNPFLHTHSYILEFSSFPSSLSFSPLASFEPDRHHFAPPRHFLRSSSSRRRDAWLSRSSSDRVRRVSLPLATRGGTRMRKLFFLSSLLTLHTDRWLHYLDSF